MTRKRFVKLMMANGNSRDHANYYARHYAVKTSGSYQKHWDELNGPTCDKFIRLEMD